MVNAWFRGATAPLDGIDNWSWPGKLSADFLVYRRESKLEPPLFGRLRPPLTDDRWSVLPS